MIRKPFGNLMKQRTLPGTIWSGKNAKPAPCRC